MTRPSVEGAPALSEQANLEQLEKEAKRLLRAYRAGESDVVREVARAEGDPDPERFALQDAQRVLARSNGFPNWSRLKHYVAAEHRPSGAERTLKAMIRPASLDAVGRGQETWQMFCAAIRNDVDTLREMLDEDAARARLEFWYTPPIHFAVREGHLDATRLLWKAHRFEDVTQLIQMAEDRGHEEVAAYLREQIARSRRPEKPKDDHPLGKLYEAIKSEDLKAVDRLLDEWPQLKDETDNQGRTPLHIAILERRQPVVERLLSLGASVEKADHAGFRPIHFAYWSGAYWGAGNDASLLAAWLLKGGARDSITLAAARGDIRGVRRFLSRDGSSANDGDTLEKRPLSAAAERGHYDIARLLLDQGADPNLPEGRNCPRGSALMAASINDDLRLAALLLEHGADPNAGIDSSGDPAGRARSDAMRGLMYRHGGQTGEIWGYIQRGDIETVAAILRYNPDPFANETAEYCSTPYTAVISGCKRDMSSGESGDVYWAMLHLFLDRGIPLPKVLTECRSYLYHVPAMTRVLLEHGLDPNLPDWQRRTPLHDLAGGAGRHVEVKMGVTLLQLFLEFGADINAIDEEFRSTPLGYGARCGRTEIAGLLLERGADPDRAGAPWATPSVWATKKGHTEIIELLREHGTPA